VDEGELVGSCWKKRRRKRGQDDSSSSSSGGQFQVKKREKDGLRRTGMGWGADKIDI